MSLRTILVNTDADGAFTYERELFGSIRAISLDIGTLETPDVTVTDGVLGTAILSLTGATTDAVYQPAIELVDDTNTGTGVYGPSAVMGTLKVVVAGGGATKHGRLMFLVDR
jgi:hypothetical protein